MRILLLFLIGIVLLGAKPAPAAEPVRPVEFNRDVRPILSEMCFTCHGPDSARRKAELRLDREQDALADRGGYAAIVPKQPDKSELIRRLTTDDDTEHMPPAKTGRKLSPQQVATLRRWIAEGARWQKHWAFIAPQRPAVPEVSSRITVRNPIDNFILERLAQEKLPSSPEAPKTTLIRRVTLDLTGLPPTPAEVDAFLNDTSADAYEKVVDRLLASPRFGERMAWRWLEAARYADTSGYQSDGERFMWRWRDWVIDAYNANMPFDRFTVEQLAGDLLPDATLDQRIATGFNRNHRGNSEGGVIPEEYAVEYVVDRVDTTATVWLGLTAGCGRCHDHKFDPISQKEFYQLFAYFNNVPERGKALKFGNSPPYIKAPTREQEEQLAALDRRLREAEEHLARLQPDIERAQSAWEKSLVEGDQRRWFPTRHLVARFPMDATATRSDRVKPLTAEDGEPAFVPGRLAEASEFDGKTFLAAGDVGGFGYLDKFTISCWVKPNGPQGGAIVSRMVEAPEGEGYGIHLVNGRVQVNLVKRWLDDALRVENEGKLEADKWYHIAVTYDGSRVARGIRIFIDGVEQKLRILLDDINQSFETKEPLRIGSGGGPNSRFHGSIDEVRIYDYPLSPEDVGHLVDPDPLAAIAHMPADKRTPRLAAKLHAAYLNEHASANARNAYARLIDLREARDAFDENIQTVMIMEEMPTPREAHILIRGEYDKKGPKVARGVPAVFPPLPKDAPNNRLGLARWLVDPANPLTARVAVNRIWQHHFGTGLVKTAEDFGSQGESPSHPELLDWLATEFMRSGWDVKGMHRLIATSATYRQSSRVAKEVLQRDPDNRLLARGPRQRLSADVLRDQALFASGLLVGKIGGPSVKPYQPAGLWKELTGSTEYVPDKGAGLYRRSLYTFWKRTVAPPTMMTFDAAGRESCIVRETRTNTPLQALALLNDVTFVEAARALAARAIANGGESAADRVGFAFRMIMARLPTETELRILLDGLQHHQERFRKDAAAAHKFLAVGESPLPKDVGAAELAAYAAVVSVILNLDEAVTKE